MKHSSEKAVCQLADRLQHRVLLRSKFVLNNDHHHQCCQKVPMVLQKGSVFCIKGLNFTLYCRQFSVWPFTLGKAFPRVKYVYGLIPFVLGFINKSRQAGADLPNLTWRLYVANFLF